MDLNHLIGLGLRQPHYKQVIEELPGIGWFEIHSENFFFTSGPLMNILMEIRKNYPISIHGVGLSLGSSTDVNQLHLNRLKQLVDVIDPFLISEHLSWGMINNQYLPDLLPMPYTKESFEIFCRNINFAQNFLKRELLIENPSSYLEFKKSDLTEVEFLVDICEKEGAKILLDINNVFVSSFNHGWNPKNYIDAIPKNLVKEIHLSGHSIKEISANESIRIDTHDDNVCPEVWELYSYASKKFGCIPTLIEWDDKIPSLANLIAEAQKINKYCSNNSIHSYANI